MIKETNDLLKMLETAGFNLIRAEYENGAGTPETNEDYDGEVTNDRNEMAAHLIACGHGILHVSKGNFAAWV